MTQFFEDKKELLLFFAVVICFILFLGNFFITGKITSVDTPSNVSVSKYLAISFGTNLAQGIQFGTVSFLPATNINATHNYDGASTGTTYTIDVSTDSNSQVDFCIKANAGLTSAALDVIGLGNETYSALNLTDSTHPLLSNKTAMTTSYVKSYASSIVPGNSSYWRFWLDIPSAQPSGDYNNSVSFEGVTSGSIC